MKNKILVLVLLLAAAFSLQAQKQLPHFVNPLLGTSTLRDRFETDCQANPAHEDLRRAKETLNQIFTLYDSGHDHLLNETYPYKQDHKASYLAGEITLRGRRVAYLWPTSGVFSGVNALLKTTGEHQYNKMLETKVLPGLDQYYDSVRLPAGYQSYLFSAGESDRFYDDNVWLALDFCELYQLTKNPETLQQSIKTWEFVISGWDDQLGGGIYWCEQKKHSKNTCSNAPGSVLALKLFEATRDSAYFNWGLRLYNWTKTKLQDSTDYLYFDNISLSGEMNNRKYTYNSGQMIQAAALLYKLTGDQSYLQEAQHIGQSVINHFTEAYTTTDGRQFQLFKNSGNWFNAILFRGYIELYHQDKNPQYITIFRDNMDHLWNQVRDNNGLFTQDWKGGKDEEHKWLLDQASLVEIWATLGGLNEVESIQY